jgi:uncharacterized protein (DUF4415 family)/uncharacterized DUF497 family protein
MKIEFDPVKSAKNAREQGLPFPLADEFDWEGALYTEDVRHAYPERRFVALDLSASVCTSSASRRSMAAFASSVFARQTNARCGAMKKKTLTDKSGEVRELRSADIRAMRRAGEVLPPPLVDVLPRRKPGQRGPQKAPTKEQVTLRLDRDVLDRFRAAGPGWQRRINDALKRARAR